MTLCVGVCEYECGLLQAVFQITVILVYVAVVCHIESSVQCIHVQCTYLLSNTRLGQSSDESAQLCNSHTKVK